MQDFYDRKLSIHLQDRIDDEVNPIIRVKSFSKVRLDTTDDELLTFSEKYVALSSGSYPKTVVADYRMI